MLVSFTEGTGPITISEAEALSSNFLDVPLIAIALFVSFVAYMIYLVSVSLERLNEIDKEENPGKFNLRTSQQLAVLLSKNHNRLVEVESNLSKLNSLFHLIYWYVTSDENLDKDSESVKELLEFDESMLQLTKVISNLEHKSVMSVEWQTYLEDLESVTSSLVSVLPIQISEGDLTNGELLQTLKTGRDELRYIVTSYSGIEYLKAVSNL